MPKFESFTQVSFRCQAVAFQVKSFDKGLGENRPDRIQHLDDQALDLEREDLLLFYYSLSAKSEHNIKEILVTNRDNI